MIIFMHMVYISSQKMFTLCKRTMYIIILKFYVCVHVLQKISGNDLTSRYIYFISHN